MHKTTYNLIDANLNGLKIDFRLGKGGMGEVWAGRDLDLDIPVAVKVLLPHLAADQDFVVRFMREARAIARLNHPNIVRVLQAGRREFQGDVIRLMVMELIEGEDALELMFASEDGCLDPKLVATIGLGVARGLAYAHSKGIIHRDIKPANILVGKDDQSVKILDFGIVQLSKTKVRNEKHGLDEDVIVGTHHYMSPEQAKGGRVGPRSDVYSLGISLFELLTGELPFSGQGIVSIVSGHLRKPIPVRSTEFSGIDPFFVELLEGMCAKAANERFTTQEVIDRLESFLDISHDSGVTESGELQANTNLVTRDTSFLGRDSELRDLEALLGDSHLVTISGPGGVGKTRLTQEFGLRQVDSGNFQDGIWFCDLTEARSAQDICSAVAKAIGVVLTQSDSVRQIETVLSLRENTLLILDNFEQVVEHAAETVSRWLLNAPEVKFVISSREPLHLEGEKVLTLGTLKDAAAELFCQRAKEANPRFEPSEEHLQAIRSIADELDGIPLAIELAASRSTTFSPQQILERLPKRLDLLRSRRRDASQRQLTLRGAIDWSWNLLNDYEQSALAQCSVFQSGFFLDAAEAVIDLTEYPDAPFEIDVIENLVDKNLLIAESSNAILGETRFRMLESIRQYAEEKLATGPVNPSSLVGRHAEHYVSYLEFYAGRMDGERLLESRDRIELELDNLFAIQDSALSPEHVPLIAFHAHSTITSRGPWREQLPRLERALDTLRDWPEIEARYPLLKINLLCNLSAVALRQGDSAQAQEAVDSAKIALANWQGKRNDQVFLSTRVARCEEAIHTRTGRLSEAREVLLAALKSLSVTPENASRDTAFHELRVKTSIAALLDSLGSIESSVANYEAAMTYYREALAIAEESGALSRTASALGNLGITYHESKHHDQALECYNEAERISRLLKAPNAYVHNIGNRGIVYMSKGDYEEALKCYSEAAEIDREIGRTSGYAIRLGNMAEPFIALDRLEDAWKVLCSAERICRGIGAKRPLAFWVSGKGRVLALQDKDRQLAIEITEEGKALWEELNMMRTEGYFESLATLAILYHRSSEGNNETPLLARELASEAQKLGKEIGVEAVYAAGPKQGDRKEFWVWIDEVLGN